ncbi:MAG: hypothetical protein HKN56_05450 [Gammaproteobacteria bacterium]|nr:hypothetical protein [Gammaproteobacteria bacterium]
MPWLIDIVAGIAMSIIFYTLVRIRMTMAPKMRDRFGARARWATWALTIGIMVVLANLGLIVLRRVLHTHHGIEAPFVHEMVFALLAFAIGFALVNRHVTRNRD